MNERDRLIEELNKIDVFKNTYQYEAIIDFILKDRKRIVQPLIKHKDSLGWESGFGVNVAIRETLKKAGVV